MYIKFLPNEYVLRYKNGKIVKEGKGISFFFLERNTSACVIPISNNDADFIFEEQTKDFLQFNSGMVADISVAEKTGRLVV